MKLICYLEMPAKYARHIVANTDIRLQALEAHESALFHVMNNFKLFRVTFLPQHHCSISVSSALGRFQAYALHYGASKMSIMSLRPQLLSVCFIAEILTRVGRQWDWAKTTATFGSAQKPPTSSVATRIPVCFRALAATASLCSSTVSKGQMT